MYVAHIIGTDIQVATDSLIEAYNLLSPILQEGQKIAIKYVRRTEDV